MVSGFQVILWSMEITISTNRLLFNHDYTKAGEQQVEQTRPPKQFGLHLSRSMGRQYCHSVALSRDKHCLFFSFGPVSRSSRNVFALGTPQQNLKPYDYRTVLFTYSKYEQRFSSYKKFQGYTPLCL